MKKIVKLGLGVLGLASLCSQSFANESNIGENFEKGAYSFSLNSSIRADKDQVAIQSEESADYYFMDGLSVGIEVDSRFNFYQDSINNDYWANLGPRLRYTFGYDSASQKGMAYSVILGSYFGFGGSNDPQTTVFNSAGLIPKLRADYFLASRASFYGEIRTNSITIYNEYEDAYEEEYGYAYEEDRAFWLSFGLSYTFAKSDFKK